MKTEDARAIEAAQEHFSCSEGQVAFIKANFSSLAEGIKCLQEKGATLEDSLALLKEIADDLKKMSGDIGKITSRKAKNVVDTNSGYETLCSISEFRQESRSAHPILKNLLLVNWYA
jgi:hypothetical protein